MCLGTAAAMARCRSGTRRAALFAPCHQPAAHRSQRRCISCSCMHFREFCELHSVVLIERDFVNSCNVRPCSHAHSFRQPSRRSPCAPAAPQGRYHRRLLPPPQLSCQPAAAGRQFAMPAAGGTGADRVCTLPAAMSCAVVNDLALVRALYPCHTSFTMHLQRMCIACLLGPRGKR